MLEENISERNGFMRLICGVALTAMGTAHLSRDSKALGFTLITAGAMKVAEGIFLHCPIKAMISSNVQGAVASTFDEYMDGDTLMKAFNDRYQANKSSSSSNNGVEQVAKAVSKAAGAVQSAADSISKGGSNSQNNSQNGSKNKNSSQSSQSKNNGQLATNPS